MSDSRRKASMAKARLEQHGGLACPLCGEMTWIIDTRANQTKDRIRRRRHCPKCEHRFTSYEMIDHPAIASETMNVRTAHLDKLIGALKHAIAEYEDTRMNP